MTDVTRMEWKQFGVKTQGHIGFEQVQRTILRVTKKGSPYSQGVLGKSDFMSSRTASRDHSEHARTRTTEVSRKLTYTHQCRTLTNL